MATERLTPEFTNKVKTTESDKEPVTSEKEHDMENSDEKANISFAKYHENEELTDEDLKDVSGGFIKKYSDNKYAVYDNQTKDLLAIFDDMNDAIQYDRKHNNN